MAGFQSVAKSLIASTLQQPPAKRGDSVEDKLDNIRLACDAGFAPKDIFRDLRELADACEDDEKPIKKSILELMIKVHGMLSQDEQVRSAPVFQLVINAESGSRVNAMLCPMAPNTN